jgi:tetratricopeptide (TPR) repeat protein
MAHEGPALIHPAPSCPLGLFRRLARILPALAVAGVAGCASSSPNGDLGRATELLEQGKAAATQGDHTRAIELYTGAVKAYPNLAEAYFQRAYCQIQLRLNRDSQIDARKLEDRAIEDYSLALERNPAFGDAFFSRAMVYSSRAQYRLAAEDLLKAIEFKPQDSEPHYWLAQLYDMKFEDKKAEANNHYEKYVELGGKDQEIRQRVKLWKELKKAVPSPEDEQKVMELHETFKRLLADSVKPGLSNVEKDRLKAEAVRALEEAVTKYGNTQYAQRFLLKTILESFRK